ncbi:unnamed protein product, partial [Allacma fusca]
VLTSYSANLSTAITKCMASEDRNLRGSKIE